MRLTRIAAWVAAVVLLAGAAHAQDTRAAIEAANKGFIAAYAKQDAAGVAGFYSTTAEAFPPGADVVKGRDAIQKMWQGVMDSGIAAGELKTTEVHAEGNFAYEVGTYVMKLKDGKVADRGKYVVVWLKEGGQWKLHRDIWNTTMPPPPPPAKK
ncbi:MAG TPA: DUF4440 domain-containing protein [Vicinamibacterales bacterium]|nr:DUF4440 domain-containing protein [Vicinamibacterales bacterium]